MTGYRHPSDKDTALLFFALRFNLTRIFPQSDRTAGNETTTDRIFGNGNVGIFMVYSHWRYPWQYLVWLFAVYHNKLINDEQFNRNAPSPYYFN